MIHMVFLILLLLAGSASAQSTCSGGGADVKYITQVSDWSSINNTAYNVFCVAPGDYKAANQIYITQDGTVNNRKYLLYYNASAPNDKRNPYHMQVSERAIVKWIELNSANYWTIKQINVDADVTSGHRFALELNNSANNIVENNMIEESYQDNVGIWNPGSDFNVIRDNVIRESQFLAGDRICVIFYANTNSEQRGNLVENNEIYNCTQAMQFLGGVGFLGAVYPDTIVRNNDMYVDSTRYTNCSGARDPNGNCFAGEEMFVLKEAGTSSTDIVWIYGNRIWGLRKGDATFGAPGGNGEGILVYGTTDYVLLENNILHETTRGLQIEGSGTNNKSAVDNIVYDMQLWVSNTGQGLLSITGDSQEWYRNTFYITDSSWRTESTNLDFRCNTLMNMPARYAGGGAGGSGSIANYNFYYNTPQWSFPGTNDIVQGTAAASNNANLTFTRKRITAPELHTIPLALTTSSSPHFNQCDPNLGSRTGVGVDDRDWSTGFSFVFSVADGGNKTVTQGNSVTQTITATTVSGVSHPIFFWHRGNLPSGVNIAYNPAYCDPGGTSCQTTATISTMGSTPTGDHSITLAGESGQWVKEDSFTLTVQSSGGDTENPVVAITGPTSEATYSTATTPITTLSGTGNDNVGVASVTWENAATSVAGSASGCSGQTSCNWAVSSITLSEGPNVITITGADAVPNEGTDIITVTLDTTPPGRSGGAPAGTLAAGTTSANISLNTTETSTCKYGTSAGVAYASLPTTFTSTNNTSHSTTVTGLSDGGIYAYYVKCQDALANANTDDFTISFLIDDDVVLLLGSPSALSTTHSGPITLAGPPSALSTTHSNSPTFLAAPSTLSTINAAPIDVLGPPTGLSKL